MEKAVEAEAREQHAERMHKAKKKNRTYARYRWREKHKKQYTFTKTKFVVGFFVSVLTSVFLGSYFDKYGSVVIHQVFDAAESAWEEPQQAPAAEIAAADIEAEAEPEQPADIERINERVKAVTITPIELKPRNRARMRTEESSALTEAEEEALQEAEGLATDDQLELSPRDASRILRNQPIFLPIPAASSH